MMEDEEAAAPAAGGTAFLVQARDGVRLAATAFDAAAPGPVAILSHGIASHQGWYRGLAAALAARGVSVVAFDRRGVGLSAGVRGHMERWRLVVDDFHRVAEAAAERHPGCPLHWLGMSLGGVFSVAAALDRPGRCQSVLALSPGFASRIKLPLKRRLRVLKRSFLKPTRLYDLPFRADELTRRPEWIAFLDQDPLRNRRVSARFLVEMFRMQAAVRRGMRRLVAPLYVLLGEQDEIVDNEAVIRIAGAMRRGGLRVELYEGADHVLPAALPQDELPERLVHWIVEGHRRASPPRGAAEIHRVAPFVLAQGDVPLPPEPAGRVAWPKDP